MPSKPEKPYSTTPSNCLKIASKTSKNIDSKQSPIREQTEKPNPTVQEDIDVMNKTNSSFVKVGKQRFDDVIIFLDLSLEMR